MVRTRADGGRKAVAAKAPRKAVASASASAGCASPGGAAASKYAGGNPVCPRPIPEWQKGIKSFFVSPPPKADEKENAEPADKEKNGLIDDDDDE